MTYLQNLVGGSVPVARGGLKTAPGFIYRRNSLAAVLSKMIVYVTASPPTAAATASWLRINLPFI